MIRYEGTISNRDVIAYVETYCPGTKRIENGFRYHLTILFKASPSFEALQLASYELNPQDRTQQESEKQGCMILDELGLKRCP